MLIKQNRLYKNYKRHGYKTDDNIRVDLYNNECKNAVAFAKQSYLRNLSCKLNDPNVSTKSYWKILNKIMNRCKSPKIPPILVNHGFVTDWKIKCNIFAKYFSEQCKLIVNSSVLPTFSHLTNARFNVVNITGELLSLYEQLTLPDLMDPTKYRAECYCFVTYL